MNNKLTTPKAILIGSFMIAGTILYTNGFNFSIIPEVKADVGGMDYRDLRRDRDFKKAVTYIVERAGFPTESEVIGIVEDYAKSTSQIENIVEDCSVYVDGDYGSISC